MYALVTSAVLIVLMSIWVCEIKIMFPETGPTVKCEGTGPDGRILKADIEDYLGELLVSSCNH